jgi:hypothetical protein
MSKSVYYVWLVDLQTICAKYGLETWYNPNEDIRKCLLDMNHGWNKNAYRDVINKKWRKWCVCITFLINIYNGLPVVIMDPKCANQVFNIPLVYLNWIFVLNTAWKRDTHQMMIYVNVCSTCFMVEIETRFETWITRNDVNGLSLFLISYLITLMAHLCSQRTRNVQFKYFITDWC